MDAAARRLVRGRAGGRCEYCGLRQMALPLASFHVEHIRAKQHGGSDDTENLALACHHCNAHKGPNLTGVDPQTGVIVPLYHPRRDAWDGHFARQGPIVLGLSPAGRATVRTLAMNADVQLEARAEAGST